MTARVLRLRDTAERDDAPATPDLVTRSAAGDERAREQLFRRHFAYARRLVERLLPGDPDAPDVLQNGFVKLFESLPRLREPERFQAFLRTILVHTARSHLRRRRLARMLGFDQRDASADLDAYLAPDAPADVRAELAEILAKLPRLSATDRMVFVLHHVEGLSHGDVAEAVGLSISTVKRRLVELDHVLGIQRDRGGQR